MKNLFNKLDPGFRRDDKTSKSCRPLKVGETIKRALTDIIRNHIHEPVLEQTSVIISEVVMTPDLKLARIYVLPMTGGKLSSSEFLSALEGLSGQIKRILAKKVYLRFMPELRFCLDTTFDSASSIDALLKKLGTNL